LETGLWYKEIDIEMFKFNNTHIFTGYLKQLLSSVNIPMCKIYTREFAQHFERTGKEDPRIIESFDTLSTDRLATYVNYLKDNEVYNYFWKSSNNEEDNFGHNNNYWKRVSTLYYDSEKVFPGLTKTLYSPGRFYDTVTHEYLGEYLRFLRDYYNINLMSLYNCFNNKICNNINSTFMLNPDADKENRINITFNSQDSKYKLYAIPVKLFENYTIAIDCNQGIELFCGWYSTNIEKTDKTQDLFLKTYEKINKTIFNQPFVYDKLDVKNWSFYKTDFNVDEKSNLHINNKLVNRWDMANREKDLRLFIRVPVSCKSSIVILEGKFNDYNNFKYCPKQDVASESWEYKQNRTILNFENSYTHNEGFTPINKLQLLAFNTGESYPFADRLIEYLSNSAITPIDQIPDNIKRAQKVMEDNSYYFNTEGLWEDKMQKILYDYLLNPKPADVNKNNESDETRRNSKTTGYVRKSTLYDILGYVDRDAEKLYTSWTTKKGNLVKNTIGNVDIYNDLYNL
jgi:hypothetical protein